MEAYDPRTKEVHLDDQSTLYACLHECMHAVQHRRRTTTQRLRQLAVNWHLWTLRNLHRWGLWWSVSYWACTIPLILTHHLAAQCAVSALYLAATLAFGLSGWLSQWAKLFHEVECAQMAILTLRNVDKWDGKASRQAREALLTYTRSRLGRWLVDRVDWTSPDVILLPNTDASTLPPPAP